MKGRHALLAAACVAAAGIASAVVHVTTTSTPGGGPGGATVPFGYPDPKLTPGSLNPQVTQDNIDQTICVPGWTRTIRPPVDYTERLKREQIAAYGYADTNPADYEEDHRVPLEVGGNPTDPHNLWPEPRQRVIDFAHSAEAKDDLENYVHSLVCSGQLTLAEGQRIFLGDFFAWRDQHLMR